jgi:DNA-binding NtrC family response regulator
MLDSPSTPKDHVLFVDDDSDVLKAAGLLLGRHGLRMTEARTPAEAWSVMAAEPVDAILLDLNFARGATSGDEGFQCLDDILARDPEAAVVVVTGHSGINIAVAAMRAGASDFVMKPWNNDRLIATINTALETRRRRLKAAAANAQAAAGAPDLWMDSAPLLGESPAIQRVRDLIRRAAPTDASVLIHGEAGTGKTLIARNLHLQSARASGPFVPVDLAGLSPDEAETALFGDGRRGGDDPGAIEKARGGTLLLEEVAALAPVLQIRLLDLLDARRAGASTLDVRVLATTRRRGTLTGPQGLRDDLFYRLNTVEILAPPLRERDGDALVLARHFLHLYAQRYDRPLKTLAPEVIETIAENPWPGDVRALRQAMERCVIFAEADTYQLSDLALAEPQHAPAAPARSDLNLVESERVLISRAMKRHNFNISQAAKELGLTRAALYRRMAKHGL